MGSVARSAKRRTPQNNVQIRLPNLHTKKKKSPATRRSTTRRPTTGTETQTSSATRAEVQSTAVKHDAQKPDYSLLTPAMLEPMTRAMMYGEKKYSRINFRAGFENVRLTSAALRHIFAYLDREDLDPESNVSHLGHAMAALAMLLDNIHEGVSTDVRYEKKEKTTR